MKHEKLNRKKGFTPPLSFSWFHKRVRNRRKNLEAGFTRREAGFTLIELLVYVVILALILTTLTQALLQIMKSYSTFSVDRAIRTTAVDVFERVGNEVRSAHTVDGFQSVFGVSPGILEMVRPGESSDEIVRLYVDTGTIKIDKDSILEGPLTGDDVNVSELIFYHLVNTESEMIVIEITLEAEKGRITKTRSFRNAFVLRGTYTR